MRYANRVQIVEPDFMGSGLQTTKAGFFSKELSFFVLTLVGFAAMLAMLCMTGCGQKGSGGYMEVPKQAAALSATTITGSVRNGATAASAARVYLLEAGPGKAGGAKSLLTAEVSRATLESTGDAMQGMYAVTADALGQFTMQGSCSCDPGATVYVYAADGAYHQMKTLGECSAASSVASVSGLRVDAASTAAMAGTGAQQI